MLTRASYSNPSYTSSTQGGGASNGFVINGLAFEDFETSACGPFKGPRAEVVLHIHPGSRQNRNKQYNDNEMTKKELQPIYVSPKVKTIEIKAQRIICGSERQSMWNSTEMEEGDDNW